VGLGRWTDFSISDGYEPRTWDGAVVRWPDGCADLFQWSMVRGVLTYQLMSFAGNRALGSVHQTYVEPEVSYNLESGGMATSIPR
jgi:hypothetical protein